MLDLKADITKDTEFYRDLLIIVFDKIACGDKNYMNNDFEAAWKAYGEAQKKLCEARQLLQGKIDDAKSRDKGCKYL